MSEDRRPSRRPGVWAFGAYATALFVATHWPALTVRTDLMRRPDLLVHMGVFCVWTLLLFFSGLLGRSSIRTALLCGIVGIVYAAIDESLQALPFIRRTAALDDFLFNVAGVALGVAVCVMVGASSARVGGNAVNP